jgi:hypothetical protein
MCASSSVDRGDMFFDRRTDELAGTQEGLQSVIFDLCKISLMYEA